MKRTLAVVFALALAVAGGWLAGRSSGSAEPPNEQGSLRARNARRDAMPDTAAAANLPQAARSETHAAIDPVATKPQADLGSPLPAIDAPLAPHLEALRRRARAGDARAACRLAMQLNACAWLPSREIYEERRTTANAAMGIRRREGQDEERAQLVLLRRMCAGVRPVDATEAFRWQQQAAMAGNRESLYRAAALPALHPEEILEHVAEWSLWRDRALAYLERSMALGDPRAVETLAELYAPGQYSPRPKVVERDPVRAYTYTRLRTRIAEASGLPAIKLQMYVAGEGGETLTPEQRAAGERESARLFEMHFAGRAPAELDLEKRKTEDFAACER